MPTVANPELFRQEVVNRIKYDEAVKRMCEVVERECLPTTRLIGFLSLEEVNGVKADKGSSCVAVFSERSGVKNVFWGVSVSSGSRDFEEVLMEEDDKLMLVFKKDMGGMSVDFSFQWMFTDFKVNWEPIMGVDYQEKWLFDGVSANSNSQKAKMLENVLAEKFYDEGLVDGE